MANKEPKSRIAPSRTLGLAGRIAHRFIDSKLTPVAIVAALLIGVFSILKTPREEEPQIVVPMLDVFIQMPGASAEEVEQRVSVPTEKLLREVPGVEYVYSISHPGVSMLIVRFYVGTNEDNAIVQTYNKLYANLDRIPPGVSQPIIKVRSIDDVPILALTLWGKATTHTICVESQVNSKTHSSRWTAFLRRRSSEASRGKYKSCWIRNG